MAYHGHGQRNKPGLLGDCLNILGKGVLHINIYTWYTYIVCTNGLCTISPLNDGYTVIHYIIWETKPIYISRWHVFSLENYDMFMSIKGNLKFRKIRNSHEIYENDTKWITLKRFKRKKKQTANNISQICCPHVELIPCVLKLWEEHKTL